MPLNLKGNPHNRFYSILTEVRASCAAEGRALPVVPNPGIGGGRVRTSVPARDDEVPFVLNVESAFQITGRGTVIMGVIEQGVLRKGDHLELIQPSSAGAAAPLRCRCRYVDAAPRVTGRDTALGYLVGTMIGHDIKPDAIRPGAKLRAAASPEPRHREQRDQDRRT